MAEDAPLDGIDGEIVAELIADARASPADIGICSPSPAMTRRATSATVLPTVIGLHDHCGVGVRPRRFKRRVRPVPMAVRVSHHAAQWVLVVGDVRVRHARRRRWS